jgi:hypothetical protein
LSTHCAKATSAPRLTYEFALWAPFPPRCLHCDAILSRGRHESKLAPAYFVLESETKAEWKESTGRGPFGLVHSLFQVCVKTGGLRPLWLDSAPGNGLGSDPISPNVAQGQPRPLALGSSLPPAPSPCPLLPAPAPGAFSEEPIILNPLARPPGSSLGCEIPNIMGAIPGFHAYWKWL